MRNYLAQRGEMKKALTIFAMTVALAVAPPAFAQGATVVNKAPNAAVTFSWGYLTTDEPKITGFVVVLEKKGASSARSIVSTVPPSARSTTIPAPALGGQYYYIIQAYFNDTSTGTTVMLFSPESPEVSVVVVVLPVPTGPAVQ
jgi:hypothetical protein